MLLSADIPAAVWDAHHDRLRRLACHKQYTQALVQWLIGHGIRFPAMERLSHCPTPLRFVYDPAHTRLRLSQTFACHLPLLCPLCALRRAAHAGDAYQRRTQSLFAHYPAAILSYAVLTIQNQAETSTNALSISSIMRVH